MTELGRQINRAAGCYTETVRVTALFLLHTINNFTELLVKIKKIYHISYMHAWGYLQILFWEMWPANTDRSSFTGPIFSTSKAENHRPSKIHYNKEISFSLTFLLLLLLALNYLSSRFS